TMLTRLRVCRLIANRRERIKLAVLAYQTWDCECQLAAILYYTSEGDKDGMVCTRASVNREARDQSGSIEAIDFHKQDVMCLSEVVSADSGATLHSARATKPLTAGRVFSAGRFAR